MTFLQAIILGLVQGLTEFLPISSSAHLVIVPYLLGWDIPISQAFVFDVLVQMGTLLAVIVYFWKELVGIVKGWVSGIFHLAPFENANARMGWYLILATIPAGLLGITIKSKVEAVFNDPLLTAALPFGTALLLVIAELVGKRIRELSTLNWKDALWIGLFQAISIFPGISRSGSTISGGMTRNLDRPSATRFSFLMSIPVLLAAGLIGLLELRKIPGVISFLPVMAAGFIAAAIVGYIAIRWLLRYISKRSFYPFAIYCAVIAALTIAFGMFAFPAKPAAAESSNKVKIVAVSPSLTWMGPLINLCSQNQNGMQVILEQDSKPSLDTSDIAIHFKGNNESSNQGILLGSEQIQVIVNPGNHTANLNNEELNSILTGSNRVWPDGSAIQVYAYPVESELTEFISRVLGINRGFSPSAKILYQPAEVVILVSQDKNAVGFVPAHFLTDSVKVLDLPDDNGNLRTMKIIASYKGSLNPPEDFWSHCLVNGIHAQINS